MTGSRRNPLGLAVLAYLAERPMHPYELGKLLTEHDALPVRGADPDSGAEVLDRHALPVDERHAGSVPERAGALRSGVRIAPGPAAHSRPSTMYTA